VNYLKFALTSIISFQSVFVKYFYAYYIENCTNLKSLFPVKVFKYLYHAGCSECFLEGFEQLEQSVGFFYKLEISPVDIGPLGFFVKIPAR